MKTIKMYFTIAMMFTIVSSYANHIDHIPSTGIITLEFSNVRKGHQLIIKDNQDTVVHRETIERNGDYLKKFDLSALKDGLYVIELEKDFEIIIKPFKIESKQIWYLENGATTIFKPVLRFKSNQLIISQLSLNKLPLNVEIFYEDKLIHSDLLKQESILNRVYRLSKLEKGEYSVRMVSGNRVFIERFNN